MLQALVGLAVLLQFNAFAIMTGVASLAIVAVYPFMKRVTYWPQIVLGLAFSWGALMGFAAVFARLDPAAFVLYAGSISWVIGYDTIYAHQDREDDALIGIKSTALLFGERTKTGADVLLCAGGCVDRRGVVAWRCAHRGLRRACGLCRASGAGRCGGSISRMQELCLRLFKSNRDAGLLLFAGLVADALMRAA